MIEKTNKTFNRAQKMHLTYTYEVNDCRNEDKKPFVAITSGMKITSREQLKMTVTIICYLILIEPLFNILIGYV